MGVFLSPLASVPGVFSFVGGGGALVFSLSLFINIMLCLFLILLASELCPHFRTSGSAAIMVNSEGGAPAGDGLEAVCQPAGLSVSQQVFICLGGAERLLDAGTRGLSPACSFSPSHHPTHNCHINSFSGTTPVPLNSCSDTLSGSLCPPGKINPCSLA